MNNVPISVSGQGEARAPRDQAVDSLAGAICHQSFPTGDLAELRRLKPYSLQAPPYWRLLVTKVPAGLRNDERRESHWAALMQAMAIMAPNAHQPTQPLGAVMAELDQGSMERRLMSLLAVKDEAMWDHLRLLARMLAAKARPINFRQVAAWLLAADEPAREKVRRSMARDFYQRQYKNSRKDEKHANEGGGK